MKKRTVIIIIIVLALALGFVYMRGRRVKHEIVRTATVETGDIQTWLSTNAVIKSAYSKEYVGTSGMMVSKVYVDVGDSVKAGDKLIEYDIADLENAVRQAEIQYENAVLNRDELIRQKRDIEDEIKDLDAKILRLDGSPNPQDIAEMQALKQRRDAMQTISDEKIRLMENNVELARMGLESAKSRLEKVKDGITAEADGVVTALNAREDTPVTMAQPLLIVQDINRLKGVIQLGKYDAAKIMLGQKATIESSGRKYDGTVSFISPAATRSMGAQDALLEAEIEILGVDGFLKIDFEANVEILTGEAKGVLKLPVECIKYDKNDNTSVFIIDDGAARLVPVSIGIQSDTEAQILEGLKEGDRVIMNPSITITDGTPVMEEGAVQ
jgi:HlyD family secretion protein